MTTIYQNDILSLNNRLSVSGAYASAEVILATAFAYATPLAACRDDMDISSNLSGTLPMFRRVIGKLNELMVLDIDQCVAMARSQYIQRVSLAYDPTGAVGDLQVPEEFNSLLHDILNLFKKNNYFITISR